MSDNKRTLVDISVDLDVSRERVRQIRNAALEKLKVELQRKSFDVQPYLTVSQDYPVMDTQALIC